MMECWESDKNERPKFAEIVSRLDKIIRSPDVLMDISLAPEPRWVISLISPLKGIKTNHNYSSLPIFPKQKEKKNLNKLANPIHIL